MFTKMCSPVANSYFLENSPAPVWRNITHGGVTLSSDRSWIAFGLVLCAHLAALAAFRPQSQSLPIETIPEPIMVSFRSATQAPQQKSKPSVEFMQKAQKPVKPIKRQVKPTLVVHKTPAGEPVVPRLQQASLLNTQPDEQTETTSSPITAQTPTTTNVKAADAQEAYQPVSFNAAYLHNPAPDYPSLSRRLGEQGKVLLRVQVTADGAAGSVALQTSSGSTRLDHAALEAVKKWRFIPAKRGGQPFSALVVVPVSFSLEG